MSVYKIAEFEIRDNALWCKVDLSHIIITHRFEAYDFVLVSKKSSDEYRKEIIQNFVDRLIEIVIDKDV